MPKKVHFGRLFENLKLTTKIGGKCQDSNFYCDNFGNFQTLCFCYKIPFPSVSVPDPGPFQIWFLHLLIILITRDMTCKTSPLSAKKYKRKKVMQQSPTQCLKVPKSLIFNFATEASFSGAFQIFGAKIQMRQFTPF